MKCTLAYVLLTYAVVNAQVDVANGPGGPVLVIASSANPFTNYYAEILRAEGLNLFAVADIATVTASTLAGYDVAILGEMPLTSAQVSMLTSWVSSGGNLIAMRPDKQLAGLLGLSPLSGALADGYMAVNASVPPGAGIVSVPIEFHGTADLYTLNGATPVATLYANSALPLANPAVTMRLGPNSGRAAAFTFDLARSVIFSRQGNPAWSGQNRTNDSPIRSYDLFYGNSVNYVWAPDWNSTRTGHVEIPFADEQQRLLVNIILQMTSSGKPLPRFWYLPFGKKAVVMMTGDDHATGGTAGRFDTQLSRSPGGCALLNWDCVRSTSYVFTGKLSGADALKYTSLGFEVALHTNRTCRNYTPDSLEATYQAELANFALNFPGIPLPSTNRTHCITWSDYDTQPQVQLRHGIRLDTTYYYYPPSWAGSPGFFTGSGLPQRFAKRDGTLIDVYQAATQMPDESLQDVPTHINALLDNALGPLGYYAVVTPNMHTDTAASTGADQILFSARSHGVSVISSLQMLRWLDARNSSSFGGFTWDGNTLNFTVSPSPAAVGLRGLLPISSAAGALTQLFANGSPVAYVNQTVKGIAYAVFPANPGVYSALYGTRTISVVVGPSGASLSANQSQAFTANVNGTGIQTVNWSMTPAVGFLSADGNYTAPASIAASQTISIRAQSTVDPTKMGTATVTLTPPPPPPPPLPPPPAPPATISVTPVGSWSFDAADINGAIALDRSGSGINGTMQSTTLVPGKSGQAVSFNGSYSSVVMANDGALQLNSDMSFVFWIKTSNATRTEAVISKYDSAGQENGYLIKTTPFGTVGIQLGTINVTSGPRQVFDGTAVNDGQWRHVAIVVALGQAVTFYVDGQLKSVRPLASVAGSAGVPFQLGSLPFTYYGAAFSGSLDQVAVYKKALSAADVAAIYGH